jgi:hypothetical protein
MFTKEVITKRKMRLLCGLLVVALVASVVFILPITSGAVDEVYGASKVVKPKIKITAVKNNNIERGGRVTVTGKITNWSKVKNVKANKKITLQVRTDESKYDYGKSKYIYKYQNLKTVKISKKGTFKITSGNINFYGSKRPLQVVVGKTIKSAKSVNVYGWYDLYKDYRPSNLIKSANITEAHELSVYPSGDFNDVSNVEGYKCNSIKVIAVTNFDNSDIDKSMPFKIHVDGLSQNIDLFNYTFNKDTKTTAWEGSVPTNTNLIEFSTVDDNSFKIYLGGGGSYIKYKVLLHCLIPVENKNK